MGQHSARRSGATFSLAGRGLFTATAAFALLGGGTGMAFAGEAPSHGHESSHGEESHGHHDGKHEDEHGGEHEEASCEIPVVDPALAAGDAAINEASGGATAPFLEAGNAAVAPVHDAACPSASELLGGGEEAADSEDTEDSEDSEDSEQAASEDAASGENAASALPIGMPL